MNGSNGSIFAIGDCTATSYAPTAQVASQQGAYLARIFTLMAKRDDLEGRLAALEAKMSAKPAAGEREKSEEYKKMKDEAENLRTRLGKLEPKSFHYSHQGSLAYVSTQTALPLLLIVLVEDTLDQIRLLPIYHCSMGM